jgi:hypothetical protein
MTQNFSVHNCKQHVVISLKYQFYGSTIPLTSVISKLQTRFISNVASIFMFYPSDGQTILGGGAKEKKTLGGPM